MNQRKRVEKLLEKLGLAYRGKRLADGRYMIQFVGTTLFFVDKRLSGATTTASANKQLKKLRLAVNAEDEHG